ncbi:MAG TPA: FixH family protein [Phycisphaerales bacterium]|nr:FixH family protein [Phycisphaerales bacterium]HMP37691.1 FixH family protein [Phycisphaerales bacterium]
MAATTSRPDAPVQPRIDRTEAPRAGFWPWPGMIFALLGSNAIVVAITIWFAHSDGGFVIEPGYDIKAARYQERMETDAARRALGWEVAIEPSAKGAPLRLRLRDRDGAELADATISIEAFHHADARRRIRVDAVDSGEGLYIVAPGPDRSGRWRLALTIVARGERVELPMDVDIARADLARAATSEQQIEPDTETDR